MSAMLHCSITTQVSAFCSFAASQLPHRELNDVSRQSGRSNKHNWRHVQAASLRCLGTALCDEIVDRRISCGKPGVARQREGSETENVVPNFLIESSICALAASARLEAPAHFCAPLASETQAGSERRAQCPKTSP